MPPEQQNNAQQNTPVPLTPPPGPPKKGFWGFVANLLPKRPKKLNTDNLPSSTNAQDVNKSDESSQSQVTPPPQSENPQRANSDGVYTNEMGGAHADEELALPPSVDVPDSLKTEGVEENDGNPTPFATNSSFGGFPDAKSDDDTDDGRPKQQPPTPPQY